ncbi:MAG: hypothetical protein WCD33_05155 [Mycobacterium sp.]|uniref:hypothetical protein n=1 Tax=Mycobacterium sp. TaxID=1785 RepID=UPI003C7426D9
MRDPAKRNVETNSKALANAFSPKDIRAAPADRLWGARHVKDALSADKPRLIEISQRRLADS